jgi:starvation-inducible DNA-binding protein
MSKVEFKVSQKELNVLLANHAVLLIQTLNYHWNIVGKEFHDYHLLLDKQYRQLFDHMDLIAERVRAVNGFALGSMKEMIKEATLKEDNTTPEPKQIILNLLKQYELLIAQIRSMIELLESKTKDFGTVNMLEEMIVQHEKTAWMLRSLASK